MVGHGLVAGPVRARRRLLLLDRDVGRQPDPARRAEDRLLQPARGRVPAGAPLPAREAAAGAARIAEPVRPGGERAVPTARRVALSRPLLPLLRPGSRAARVPAVE